MFPKTPGLKPHHQMQFSVISRTLVGASYLSAEMQLAYSLAPINWAKELVVYWIHTAIHMYEGTNVNQTSISNSKFCYISQQVSVLALLINYLQNIVLICCVRYKNVWTQQCQISKLYMGCFFHIQFLFA